MTATVNELICQWQIIEFSKLVWYEKHQDLFR